MARLRQLLSTPQKKTVNKANGVQKAKNISQASKVRTNLEKGGKPTKLQCHALGASSAVDVVPSITLQDQYIELHPNLTVTPCAPIRKCVVKLTRMPNETLYKKCKNTCVDVAPCRIKLHRIPLGEVSIPSSINTKLDTKAAAKHSIKNGVSSSKGNGSAIKPKEHIENRIESSLDALHKLKTINIPPDKVSMHTNTNNDSNIKAHSKHLKATVETQKSVNLSTVPKSRTASNKLTEQKENIQNNVSRIESRINTVAINETNPSRISTKTRNCRVKLFRIAFVNDKGNKSLQNSTRFDVTLSKEKRLGFNKLSLNKTPISKPIKANIKNLKQFQPLKNSTLNTQTLKEMLVENLAQEEVPIEEVNEEIEAVAEAPQSTDKDIQHENDHRNEGDCVLESNKALKTNIVNVSVPPKRILKKKAITRTNCRPRKSMEQRTSPVSDNHIYDFLSQSETSDLERVNDPAADVIQRLIKEGKVRVATLRKGKGRPTIKRKPDTASVKIKRKVNKAALPKKRAIQKKTMTTLVPKNPLDIITEADENFIFEDDALPAEEDSLHIEMPPPASAARITHSKSNINTSAEGTFSRLARSVLLQQAAAGRKSNTDKRLKYIDQRKMLEVVRNFVSTPVQKKLPLASLHTTMLSPIAASTTPASVMSTAATSVAKQQHNGNVSPWRVDEDAHLPSCFNFSLNSTNLPSFSSDFIPATPKKKPNNTFIELLDETTKRTPLTEQSMIFATPESPPPQLTPSTTMSSYASNDSNAENKPPPSAASEAVLHNLDDHNSNAVIFNSRQQPNPRRMLSNRSPLKQINILQVVELQPWKASNQPPPSPSPSLSIGENASTRNSSSDNSIQNSGGRSHTILDLFGFEEFIADDETDKDGGIESTATMYNCTEPNQSHLLGTKLHELRRWRPISVAATTKYPVSKVFDDDEGRPKQRCLREMLCSTMINQSKTTTAINAEVDFVDNGSDLCVVNRPNKNLACTADVSNLFQDTEEPETTFNEKNPHRTYVRQFKRKRRMRNDFSIFLESDESDEDNSHENDNSGGKKAANLKKKRKHKEAAPNEELKTFVNEFNDMCRDVEQYELVVEKSA